MKSDRGELWMVEGPEGVLCPFFVRYETYYLLDKMMLWPDLISASGETRVIASNVPL